MPIYLYENPEDGRVIELIQGMNEDHSYIDEKGVEWKRVFTSPNANFDSQIDPFSQSDYRTATTNKNGTLGDMMDLSKELSQQRADKNGGVDPIAEKHRDNYEKNTGNKHPDSAKVYESKNVRVEYD